MLAVVGRKVEYTMMMYTLVVDSAMVPLATKK